MRGVRGWRVMGCPDIDLVHCTMFPKLLRASGTIALCFLARLRCMSTTTLEPIADEAPLLPTGPLAREALALAAFDHVVAHASGYRARSGQREMAAHMTDALTRVRELSTARVGPRLAHALLRLVHQCGRDSGDGSIVLLHSLTRQELAELTGTTIYTVSRTLSQWTTDGVLGTSGRRLVVRDRARLERLSAS